MAIKYPPELHPSIIEKEGKKEGVILTISEYEKLQDTICAAYDSGDQDALDRISRTELRDFDK